MSDTALTTTTTDIQQQPKEDEFEQQAKGYLPFSHPTWVKNHLEKEIEQQKAGQPITPSQTPDGYSYRQRAATMYEFDTGILLVNTVPDAYQSLAIKLMLEYQQEFGATTASEKSLCEMAAISYIRGLEATRRLKEKMESVETRYDIQYVAILSNEVDRANRHFTSTIQELRIAKRPPLKMTVNVKGQANIAQNQQINNEAVKNVMPR